MGDGFSRTVAVVRIDHCDGEVRFGFAELRGRRAADIRLWTEMAAGVKSGTRSGLSVGFDSLPALVRAMQELEAHARKGGLIGDGL